MEKILILDFGSQTTALIGRRIREFGVYAEIVPGDTQLSDEILRDTKGLILSGSPESVYAGGPIVDGRVYGCGLPLLGICYGLQRMTTDLGGIVEALPKREYGAMQVQVNPCKNDGGWDAFLGFVPTTRRFTAWFSHGDTLTKMAPGFSVLGLSATGFPALIAHETKPWFGVQFHPEVSHCEFGSELLESFVFAVCQAKREWSMESYIEEVKKELVIKTKDSPVLLLISGGVDSTVAGALLLKSLSAENVHLMYVDTGLMRKGETEAVTRSLERLGAKHLHIVQAESEFLAGLAGKVDPEAKRKVIGDLFIKIQEREVARLGLPDNYFLVQGTLYTDLIESGKGVGQQAHLIKSHHNVGSPLVDEKRRTGRVLEPLDKLYKDECRKLGRLLGVDEEVLRRHPFPGPGLGIRILGEVTKRQCDILREADAVYISELKKRRLYDEIWQAFAVLLPVRSVGVAGDSRKYGYVLALRAVTSKDGMTADVYPFPPQDLLEISTLITNQVPEIGRVTYDVSSKPPATIEWE